MIKRKRELPERSVAVEVNIKTHEEEGSDREDGLPQSQSQAGTRTQSTRHVIHFACNCDPFPFPFRSSSSSSCFCRCSVTVILVIAIQLSEFSMPRCSSDWEFRERIELIQYMGDLEM